MSAPGQATTSRTSSAPGWAMPIAIEPLEQQRELLLGQIAEHDVLAIASTGPRAELTLDRGERAELIGRDVAQRGVRVGARPIPLPAPRTTFA